MYNVKFFLKYLIKQKFKRYVFFYTDSCDIFLVRETRVTVPFS